MSVVEYYDPDTRWGRDFGYRDPIYTLGYHRGQDLRKTDPTGSYSVVTDIVSLSDGVVSNVYTSQQTGREVVVDTGRGRGRYEIHCHATDNVIQGTRVRAGGRIARNAGWGENPGTSWGGPHDHFVISDYPDAGHNTGRPVYDPRPFIRDALAAVAAGGGSSPFNPTKPLEDDDMIALHIYGSGGKQYSCALGVGVFRHFVSTDPVEEIKNQLRIQDDWQETDLAKLPALLRTYGCDLNIWDVRNGDFAVLDPLDGSVKAGNVWTATGAIRAAIKGIVQPTIDPTPIVDAVKEAIEAGRDYDAAEIAEAVRAKFRTDPLS